MQAAKRILIMLLVIPLVTFIMINIHEIGHLTVARVAGDSASVYYLYRHWDNGDFCIGCTTVNSQQLSTQALILFQLGGVLATQITALVLVAFLYRIRNQRSRTLIGFALLIFASDLVWQVGQGLVADVMAQNQRGVTGVDLSAFLYLLNQQTGLDLLFLKGILAAGCALWVVAILILYRGSHYRPEPRLTLSAVPEAP